MLKSKQLFLSSFIVALALGTAWAVRGKFGHEQGAAWAGAAGVMALILVAKRQDWYNKVFKIGLAGAIGWGLSGMISYGQIVGYGRAGDFVNAYYGLLMLFVIGLLYGFLGGGLVGLTLVDSKNFKVKWAPLMAEMVAMALLTYGLLINQLEWFMTPPRSELWAACLGGSFALAWYAHRNKLTGAMNVAMWSAIGAGFGFAFGNFLHVLSPGMPVTINYWNVMEYSIGFFGGLGMAYGTFISKWPVLEPDEAKSSNLLPLLFVVIFVPFVLWEQSFLSGDLHHVVELGADESTIWLFKVLAISSIASGALIILMNYYKKEYSGTDVKVIFIVYLSVYTFLSFLLTGVLVHPIEQYLYIVNIIAILVLLPSVQNNFVEQKQLPRQWVVFTVLSIFIIAVFALIAINSHDGMPGSNVRF